jgi:Fe-S-cluster containining protein
MEKDLDLAYGICEKLDRKFPCKECGKCCNQKLITVRPEEVDSLSSAAGIPLGTFMSEYVGFAEDGRIMLLKTDPCAFLGKDRKCTVWKDRPSVCRQFPYMVSTFMSRVYLSIVNETDILPLLDYMDDSWPCTRIIKENIEAEVAEAVKERRKRLSSV